MLNKEQAQKIKNQLFSQIENLNINKEDKDKLKNYISSLNEEELENFLIKNNLIRINEEKTKNETKQNINKEIKKDCVFCLIVNNLIPSYKIAENKSSIATLEIKPISKGHIIVIPKKHLNVDKIPLLSFSLAKEIAKKIKKIFKPKEVAITTSNLFGHGVINVIPNYGNETLTRYEAKKEELEELQKLLMQNKNEIKNEKQKKNDKIKKSKEEVYKFPRRIP